MISFMVDFPPSSTYISIPLSFCVSNTLFSCSSSFLVNPFCTPFATTSPSNHSTNTMSTHSSQNKYKGVRRRKWGKWVSEIRVPGTSERLWLGSYTTPEAAAVAHDVAFYCLRGNASPQNLNFPLMLPGGARVGMSPRSVQQAASDAGLAIDARHVDSKKEGNSKEREGEEEGDVKREEEGSSWGDSWRRNGQEHLSISVDDYL